MTNLVNEAQRDVINNTWAVEIQGSQALTVGTTYYAADTQATGFIVFSRMTSQLPGQSPINLPEASLIYLDANYPGWQSQQGVPQFYFMNRTQRNPNGDLYGVFPVPGNTASTTTLTFNYYTLANDLSGTNTTPFNGISMLQPYNDLLILYPAYRVYLIEGEKDKATLYRQEYESRLAIMVTNVGKRPNFIPSMGGPSNSR